MEILGFRLTTVRMFFIALSVLAIIFIPPLRAIAWWILPLGSGWDDFIAIAALIVIFVAVFVDVWSKRYKNNPYNKRRSR